MPNDNKRIFYASQSIHLQPVSTGNNDPIDYRNPTHYITYGDGTKWIQPRGLQSAGISTTFNSEPVSQMGTLQIYSQTETVPEVEVTLNKVIDGTAPLYSLCAAVMDAGDTDSIESVNKDITEIANTMVNVRFAVFSDSNSYATGVADNHTLCQKMYLSSVNFTFPVDGNATEEVSLVGSNKTWGGTITVPGDGDSLLTSDTATPFGSGDATIVRRQFVAVSGTNPVVTRTNGKLSNLSEVTYSVLPTGIPRETNSAPQIQNINISADFGREAINELGYFGPYYRYVNFPLEVTCEIEVISTKGDKVNADDFSGQDGCDSSYNNLYDEEIVVKVCGPSSADTLILDLGTKNKLTSVNYTGGDTGGGNVSVTYSYQTFNKLNVIPVGSYANYVSFTDGSDGTIAVESLQ